MKYPGSLASRAAQAGKSVEAFAEENKRADSTVGKLARLYFLQQGFQSGNAPVDKPGDARTPGQTLYQVG